MTDPSPASDNVRILLMAPNWLGDAIMFDPLVDYLYQHRHGPSGQILELTLAIRPAWSTLYRDDFRLKELLPVQRGQRHSGSLGAWHLGRDFSKHRPRAVVLGPPSFRAGLAARISGAPLRFGYRSDGRSFLLNHGLPVAERGQQHHGQELLALGPLVFQALGWKSPEVSTKNLIPRLPGLDSIKEEPIVDSNDQPPLWVLAPGATYGSAKSWPLNRALDFARRAINDRAVRLLLLGDAEAGVFANALAEGLNLKAETQISGPAGLVDLTGKTQLPDVVRLLKNSQVFVGNDSGLMHLSAAVGTLTVGIFGSSNPLWTRPLGSRTRVVVAEGFACHPCYRKNCNQETFCLDKVSADAVFQAIDDGLKDTWSEN